MGTSVNSRELVLETLLRITRDGEYSHIALKEMLDTYQYLEKKERAFITRVVNGTLERMIEIDYILDQFSKVKVHKMKPVIRAILRSGVYQLKYMDSVPASAVCNEAVKLAVKRGFGTLKGFVNGVLRSISRGLDDLSYPPEMDVKRSLSVRYSLPEWLVDQWLSEYGKATVEQMGAAFLEEHPTSVRCNLTLVRPEELQRELEDAGVSVRACGELPYAFYISGYDHLAGLPGFAQGHFYIQDVSSMQAAEWADPKENDVIVDVCAAPGGKAIHLAEKLSGTGYVEARDLTDYKIGLIRENIARSRLDNIRAVRQDATVYDEASGQKADIVIADLPCSGLGVLGKKPDLKYRTSPQAERELAGLQRQILSVVHRYVKPGGKLLYSTCTVNRGENEDNAQWFLKEYPQFRLVKERQRIPGRDSGDGFYTALFVRE